MKKRFKKIKKIVKYKSIKIYIIFLSFFFIISLILFLNLNKPGQKEISKFGGELGTLAPSSQKPKSELGVIKILNLNYKKIKSSGSIKSIKNEDFSIKSSNELIGYASGEKNFINPYIYQILSSDKQIIYSSQFEVPNIRYYDYQDEKGNMNGGITELENLSFSISFPSFPDEASIRIFNPQGNLVDTEIIPPSSEIGTLELASSVNNCTDLNITGDPAKKLDIVFIGNGYPISSMPYFYSDVMNNINYFSNIEPFKTDFSRINFHLVNQSLDLGCNYNCGGIARLICCNDTLVFSAASQCPHDQIIVLVNSYVYGGSGGGYAVSYIGTYMNQVTIHEFGHSFGKLGDEYSYGYPGSIRNPSVNCDNTTSGDQNVACPKWSWANGLPNIGCYNGCGFTNLYRPTDHSCLMNLLIDQFDQVCQHQIKYKLSFYSDSTFPSIIIHSPKNITYASSDILLNYTTSDDDLESCWYNLDGKNFSLICNQSIPITNLEDGNYNLTLLANDSSKNINSSSVDFSIDTTPPYITFISPQSSIYHCTSITLKLTNSSDTSSIWWFNGSANVSYSSPLILNLEEGYYSFIAYANDSFANLNSTNVKFYVNITYPAISFTSNTDTNGSYLDRNNIIIEINVSSICSAIANINITLYNSSNDLIISNLTESSQFLINYSHLREGKYYFNASVYYMDGKIISTPTWFVIIDTTSPEVLLISPEVNSHYNPGQKINLSVKIRDSSDISNVFVNITLPNKTIQEITLINSTNDVYNNTFDIPDLFGVYNVTFIVYDIAGNINESVITYFKAIDSTSPEVIINSPKGNYNNAIVIFNITLNEFGFCSCSIDNGVTNISLSSFDNLTYSSPSGSLSNGDYILNAYCQDSAGNINNSVMSSFSINVQSQPPDKRGGTSGGGRVTTNTEKNFSINKTSGETTKINESVVKENKTKDITIEKEKPQEYKLKISSKILLNVLIFSLVVFVLLIFLFFLIRYLKKLYLKKIAINDLRKQNSF